MRSPLLLLLVVLFAGCLRLERDYPERQFFTLESHRPGAPSAESPLGPLRLERIGVSSRFQGKSFVYRTGDLQYEEDFYNRFVATPRELVTEETARWLRSSGLFPHVYSQPAPVLPNLILDGMVSALYGDFQGPQAKAVLAIAFTLTGEEAGRPRVLLTREYRREIPLEGKTPAALAAGWSEALTQILSELEGDLREAAG